MKLKIILRYLMAIIFFTTSNVFAQVPQAISYQAVARDNNGNLIANQNVTLEFRIYDAPIGGNLIYHEQQSVGTNAFGLINVEIGLGTPILGTFSSVNWGNGSKYLEVELNGTAMGRQQMLSVPYALYAEKTNTSSVTSTYRWATFHTYDQTGWALSNNANLFGGIEPSTWTDANAIVSSLSSDKELLRTLFVNKGYAKNNAMVLNENFIQYSSTNGKVVLVLFRIKNSTGSVINWSPSFYYSAYDAWSEKASVSLNGSNVFSATNSGNTTLVLPIPANRVSTVIFASTSGTPVSLGTTGLFVRNCRLAFYNNSLQLPAGLSFVDDLDTATGGWEQ